MDHSITVTLRWSDGSSRADVDWTTNPENDSVPLRVVEALKKAVDHAFADHAKTLRSHPLRVVHPRINRGG